MEQEPSKPPLDVGQLAQLRADARSGRARQIRLDAHISLTELAAASGTNGPNIHRWETGKRSPRPAAASRYAAALAAIEHAQGAASNGAGPPGDPTNSGERRNTSAAPSPRCTTTAVTREAVGGEAQ